MASTLVRRWAIPATAITALGFAPAGSRAETLTLPEAVRTAMTQSPLARESLARAEAARQARREAARARLPGIELREIAIRTDSPADAFALELMQERFSFPAFAGSDPNDPEPVEDFATEIEATWPLYTGGRLTAGIRQADRMSRAASSRAAHTEAAIELSVVEAYLGRLLAERFVDLAERAHATTARHVEQAQAFFDAGMIVESDLLQARVQLARMEENRITARHRLELARAGLNQTMGLPLEKTFELVEPADSLPPPETPLAEAIEQARSRRADLKAAEAAAEAASFGVRQAVGGYLPELAVRGRLSLHDDRFLEFDGRSTTLMGIFRWTLFDGGQTAARVARSRQERNAAREGARGLAQQVEMEVRSAWQGVDEARARVTVAAQALASAERALTILEDRYEQGVARTTDLLDAETEAHDARVRRTQARFDLERAHRTLRFAVGEAPVPEVNR